MVNNAEKGLVKTERFLDYLKDAKINFNARILMINKVFSELIWSNCEVSDYLQRVIAKDVEITSYETACNESIDLIVKYARAIKLIENNLSILNDLSYRNIEEVNG
ncbi:MAG: hypothetical protein FWC41_07695 [Firmicutes bacterium]|nr:hypothetical protein [Bacillota bacterium]